jgi:rhodanese-related sulfurtransferase
MRLITRQQLKAELEAGQPIKLVMTAGPWQVRAKHIPGTLKLLAPKDALGALRPDDQIVVYAIDDRLQSSAVAWEALTAHGYRDVRRYAGGLKDWEAADYPVEGQSVATPTGRRWPRGHSPHGRELQGGCPHCDQGWSGSGWPTPLRVQPLIIGTARQLQVSDITSPM